MAEVVDQLLEFDDCTKSKAQLKMHCALGRTCGSTQKFVDWEKKSVSKKNLQENKFRASFNDCEVSSVAWRNSDHRCPLLTFLTPEPHGQWRIVALPLQCLDHTANHQSESHLKMESLPLVSPSVAGSVRVDHQKARRGPATERSSPVKSRSARSLPGSNFQYHSRNKGLSRKVSRQNRLPDKSSDQTSLSNSDSSVVIPSLPNATNLSDIPIIDASKADKAGKTSSRKNTRKKGRRNKKPSHNTSPAEQECVPGSSTSDIGITKNTDNGIGSLSSATRLAASSPEHIGSGNDSESSSCTINYSETSKTRISFNEETDVLEATHFGKHRLSNSESGVRAAIPESSPLHGEQDTHSNPRSCFSNQCSSILSETKDSSVFDSTSVCSNDDNTNAGPDTEESNKDINGIDLSEPSDCIEEKEYFSSGNMLSSVADCYYQTGASTCPEQRCRSGDSASRTKQIKKVPRNSGASHPSSVGRFYGRCGKENNHSIWQKVQKNNTKGSSYEQVKVNSDDIHRDSGLKEAPLLKKNCSIAQSCTGPTCEGKSQLKVKACRKLKRKSSSGTKQEINYYPRKGTYAIKENSNPCVKTGMPQNEILDIPVQLSKEKGLKGVSRSGSKLGSQRIRSQSDSVEPIPSEHDCSLEGHHSELELLEHACDSISTMNNQLAKEKSSLSSGFHNDENQTELLMGNPPDPFHPGSEEDNQMEKDVSHVGHGKQDHSSGSVSQKWMPVGTKHSRLARSGHSENLKLAEPNKPATRSLTVGNMTETAYGADIFVSSKKESVTGSSRGTEDDGDLHSDSGIQPEKLRNQSTCSCKESRVNHIARKCACDSLTSQNNFSVNDDSDEIAQTVNDAYRTQLVSEAVQMATGYPIAEFERFLYSAAPVISLSSVFLRRSHDGITSMPLGRHEIPNISLGSLWQWYEKHGTYGLEVRADDYENSKRFGIDRFTFRAYFVPFLSAVQLFRECNCCPSASSNGIPGSEASEACKLNEISGNSCNIGSLPIFSVLVPRPHAEGSSAVSPRNCVCYSETSSLVSEGNTPIQSDDVTNSDDLELLFEYFEVEQPQQRRPLFEMVKELARGEGASQSRVYGDPTKLYTMSLNDLHPKSWYSVAWYPIYRIPDGNLRAAFLTYHSLGHLIHRSATSDSFSDGACIVSPVVGLQSYNAQGECWFQLRRPTQNRISKTLNLNPSEIMKDRLRTLERTASLMARAVVTKGNHSSVNRQPDYEFFLSRRRW